MKAGSILSKTFTTSKSKPGVAKDGAKDGGSSQRSGTNKTQNQNSLYDAFYEAPEDGDDLFLPPDIDTEPKPQEPSKITEADFIATIDPK